MSNPRLSPCGSYLSWLQWFHPNMPWDGTELWVATLTGSCDGVLATADAYRCDGGNDVSIVGPQWLQNGQLVYSSDASGWWNLYAYDRHSQQVRALTKLKHAEIGAAAWAIGTTRFVELCTTSSPVNQTFPHLAVAITEQASDRVAVLNPNGELQTLPLDCAAVRGLSATNDGGLLVLAELRDSEAAHFRFTAPDIAHCSTPRKLTVSAIAQQQTLPWSIAEPIQFASGNTVAHAFFYPPCAAQASASATAKPPLIVMGHGGPTSHATPALRLSIQYWTSRGFAVADVNYRGSTGFGRQYRQGLNEQWGVVDVEDCISVAQFLAETGRVDGKRCVIRGGSAGGLTVLRALQLSDVFAAGTSLYGVADLQGLLAETHKFESRYLDGLIGAYPTHSERYHERSPIHHAQNINVPILVLQGDEDKVVPPSQSEAIVHAVASRGLPHAYVLFAGEQHGWRQASTLVRALELELWFYGAALGFQPADEIDAPPEAVGF